MQWACQADDSDPTITDNAALAAELDNSNCQAVDSATGSVLECRRDALDNDGKNLCDVFIQSAFSKVLNRSWDFECRRESGEIVCGQPFRWMKIAPVATWRVDRQVGRVSMTIGQVGP
jgi:hypothetical protein